MINLPIVLLIAIIGYALAITGLFICAFAGSASDRQKAAAIIHNLKKQVKHFIIEADKALRALETVKTDLNRAQALADERQSRIIELLHEYVHVQNEYAWYRVTRGAETPTYLNVPLSSVKSAPSALSAPQSAGTKEAPDA